MATLKAALDQALASEPSPQRSFDPFSLFSTGRLARICSIVFAFRRESSEGSASSTLDASVASVLFAVGALTAGADAPAGLGIVSDSSCEQPVRPSVTAAKTKKLAAFILSPPGCTKGVISDRHASEVHGELNGSRVGRFDKDVGRFLVLIPIRFRQRLDATLDVVRHQTTNDTPAFAAVGDLV